MTPASLATRGACDPGAALALYRLLIAVMGTSAPGSPVVGAWSAYDRALVRRWGERELARKTTGFDGCPGLAIPGVLARFARTTP